MNRNPDHRIRVCDALVDGVLVLAIAAALFPALGAAVWAVVRYVRLQPGWAR